jgi:serine/threonine protein kinase
MKSSAEIYVSDFFRYWKKIMMAMQLTHGLAVLSCMLYWPEVRVYFERKRTSPILLFVDTPWDSPTTGSPEYEKYRSGLLNFSPWIRFSEDAKSLLRCMLAIDPNKRITMDEVINHPWYLR